ncbi:MAG: redoxin domain-containing protein [Bacteroidota bacterium]
MKRLLLSLSLCLLGLVVNAQAPLPGSVIPTGVFYTMDGKTFSTSMMTKDKKSLIMFYDATCDHCQRVGSVLSKRRKELAGVNLYMVSQDEPESINYFMKNYAKGLPVLKNVTLLRDIDRVFIPLFHPTQYPSLYLYGKDKKLIYFSSAEKDVPKFFPLLK